MTGQIRRAPTSASARWQSMRFAALVACAAFLLQAPSTISALSSVTMAYKPPVKSSVSKLRSSSRIPTDPTRGAALNNPPVRSPTSRSSFAGALAPPAGFVGTPNPAPVPTECFEKRMRNLVLGNPAIKKRTRTVQKPANVVTVETLADYKRVVADEKDRVVAVRFHGEWCRACKAMAPSFYHLALKNPDTLFVDVPVKEGNANLHQGLGVPSLPYGHVYHPINGLVEELRITKKLMPEFRDKLQGYIQEVASASSSQ